MSKTDAPGDTVTTTLASLSEEEKKLNELISSTTMEQAANHILYGNKKFKKDMATILSALGDVPVLDSSAVSEFKSVFHSISDAEMAAHHNTLNIEQADATAIDESSGGGGDFITYASNRNVMNAVEKCAEGASLPVTPLMIETITRCLAGPCFFWADGTNVKEEDEELMKLMEALINLVLLYGYNQESVKSYEDFVAILNQTDAYLVITEKRTILNRLAQHAMTSSSFTGAHRQALRLACAAGDHLPIVRIKLHALLKSEYAKYGTVGNKLDFIADMYRYIEADLKADPMPLKDRYVAMFGEDILTVDEKKWKMFAK